MGIFSKKKGKEENSSDSGISSSLSDWNQDENNKIPRVLPSTLMQRLSLAQNAKQDVVIPQKIFTDDIKSILRAKSQIRDEYKKIPDDIHYESKYKPIDKHELEKVIMLRDAQRAHEVSEAVPAKESVRADVQEKLPENQDKEEGKEQGKVPDKVQRVHHHSSFFAELEKFFSHRHGVKHVLSQDMMAKMKEYHDAIGRGESFFMHETDIEREIESSLSELKNMESEWILMKKGVTSAEKLLYAKEEELERKLGDFRNLLLSVNRFKDFNVLSPEGNSFVLSNGVRLYSIQHLLNEIPVMEDWVFYRHVNPDKNDFSSWIRDIFKLEDLALKLSSAKTKEEMLQILRKY